MQHSLKCVVTFTLCEKSLFGQAAVCCNEQVFILSVEGKNDVKMQLLKMCLTQRQGN